MLRIFSVKAVVFLQLISLLLIWLKGGVCADQPPALSIEEFKKQFIETQIGLLPTDFSKKISEPSKFNSSKAIESYEKFKDQKFDINVYKVMAYNYFLEKKYEHTDKQFNKTAPLAVGDSEKFWLYYNWGINMHSWGEKLQDPMLRYRLFSIIVFATLTGHDPSGEQYKLQAEYLQAKDKFIKAIEISPNSAEAYYHWGLTENALFQPELAVEKFMKAVEINPSYKEAYAELADNLRISGKNKEALEKYQKAAELDPRNPAIYSNWGVALSNLGKYEEAIEKYQKNLELKPKNSKAYSNWAVCLFSLERYEEALEKCNKSIELDIYNAEGYYILAKINLINNQKEETLKNLEKALDYGKYLKRPARNDKDFKKIWGDPEFRKMTKP